MKTPLYLLKDIIIPAGTMFHQAPPKTERIGEGHISHIVGLSKDTSGEFTYFAGEEGSEEREQLKEIFSETKPQPPPACGTNMDIGGAVAALEAGKQVAREGWNGKGMWLELQVPDEHSKMTLPYVWMKTACGNRVPWLCSQTDLLAKDWIILS